VKRRTGYALTLPIVMSAVVSASVAYAENFKLLGGKEIRARVIGRDMTDSTHWVSYFRKDGVLLSDEKGQKWTGVWKIRNNRLCMSNPSLAAINCNEVWMSGANIRLRANKDEETFDALIETHRTN
jgi:hypothetical protein